MTSTNKLDGGNVNIVWNYFDYNETKNSVLSGVQAIRSVLQWKQEVL